MQFQNAAIPLGLAWSSPFAKWQGSFAGLSSSDLAEAVTKRALSDRQIDPESFDALVLGWTIPQIDSFFGAPTLAARIGAPLLSGPMVSQACATGVASLQHAAASVGTSDTTQLVVTTDRTSNGPLLVQPNPSASGGTPGVQVWVLEAFARDPWAGTSMLDAAEAVAAVHGFTRAEADELAVMRHEQYAKAVADPSFQKAYMVPVEIASRSSVTRVDGDEGVRPATAEGVATLRPAVAGGVHTFATQTHPADGSAGCVVTSVKRARELSIGGEGVARILSAAIARVAKTRMPEAPVPAALAALDAAGLEIKDVDAINSHNPFAVNDLYFARQTGVKPEEMNRFGCSLVYGHPQAPTGLRSIVELTEELRRRGGGTGLFTGCAAGDTAGAVVINVTD